MGQRGQRRAPSCHTKPGDIPDLVALGALTTGIPGPRIVEGAEAVLTTSTWAATAATTAHLLAIPGKDLLGASSAVAGIASHTIHASAVGSATMPRAIVHIFARARDQKLARGETLHRERHIWRPQPHSRARRHNGIARLASVEHGLVKHGIYSCRAWQTRMWQHRRLAAAHRLALFKANEFSAFRATPCEGRRTANRAGDAVTWLTSVDDLPGEGEADLRIGEGDVQVQ
mmetsp:Transcript_105288/g.224899  ORF Transcript_105288/g.224899 Transcript_105288/m.224899 type:complete len:230 (-) Transcript_105288:252-941(-)